MTKRKDPPVQQAELPMKDVTPKTKPIAAEKLPKVRAAAKKAGTAVAHRAPDRAAPTPVDPKNILQMVAALSENKNIDAQKTEAILRIVRQEQDRLNDIEFERTKLAVQIEMPDITKDSWNDHTKSTWARLEKISAVADPIIRRHGFTLSFSNEECPVPDHYRISCIVTHTPTGHKKTYWMDVGMDHAGAKGGGTKSLAQGSGSSQTYGRRFLKINIFDLNVTGLDRDGNALPTIRPKEDRGTSGFPGDFNRTKEGGLSEAPPKPLLASPAQLTKLRDAIGLNEVPEDKVLEHYSIRKLEDIEARFVDPAIKQCQDYGANLKANRNGR
jgi:hypothetical protein